MEKELIRIAKALEGIEKELHQLNKKMEPIRLNPEELADSISSQMSRQIQESTEIYRFSKNNSACGINYIL